MDYRGRNARLQQVLEEHKVDALVVTHLPNVRYLCGFTGSAGVVVANSKPRFFTDGRYAEQAREQVHVARPTVAKGGLLAAAAEFCSKARMTTLGIEADHLTVAQFDAFTNSLGKGVKVKRVSGFVETLRVVKESKEIDAIRSAVDLSSKLFRPLARSLRAGEAESSAAARLEYAARRAGAQGMSFETIVASGARSALPHGVASAAPIAARGFVVLDYGVILNGYCSDMTRTVHMGKASEEFRSLYRAVLEAQLCGIAAVRPGATAGEVDDAARDALKRSRLAKYFTHSTGHGVGLEIHEPPRLANSQTAELQPGMVITIEPGIYIPGKCGIRIEDMVLVTERGYEVLTPVSKELLELQA